MTSIRTALAAATEKLAAAGVDAPRREARLLLAHAMRLSPQALPDPDAPVDTAALATLVARRAAREPLALITGKQGFWSLILEVSPATLIPRADSETLIEAAQAAFPDPARVHRVLDLGTGTGCLLLAALSLFPNAFGIGVDLSPAAAALAARNAAANGLSARAAFLAGDWAAALSAQMDLVLCNPPYIAAADMAGLMPEVARFEPARALDGGAQGLDAYTRIIPTLPSLLAPGGVAILELGAGQAEAIAALAEAAGFRHIAARPDLAGVSRALVLAGAQKKQFGTGRAGS